VAYGLHHQTALTVGGWLQVTGTVLTVIFAISVVVYARQTRTLQGVLVFVGSGILVVVGLSELTAYKVLALAPPLDSADCRRRHFGRTTRIFHCRGAGDIRCSWVSPLGN
jgi:hypothetical protein